MSGYNILHVIDRLADHGAGRTLRTLVHEAGSNCQMQIAAFSVCCKGERKELADVDVHVLNGRWSWDFVALGRLARLLHQKRFDVVHVWDAPSLRRVQTLSPRRVPMFAMHAHAGNGNIRSLHRVARIFAGSRLLRDELSARGVSAKKITVVPPGVSVPAAAPLTRDQALARAELPVDAILLAVAGPLVRSSRFDEAIWRYELVRVLYPTARLVVAGNGPQRGRLERFTRLVSDPQRVRILPAGELADALLAHADVYWQTDNDATPRHELLDAMHRGTPIVAADRAVIREIVDHQRTGMLADPDDRADFARMTDRILRCAETGKRLGEAARAESRKRFGAADSAGRFCQAYEAVAGLTRTYPPLPNEPATCTTRH